MHSKSALSPPLGLEVQGDLTYQTITGKLTLVRTRGQEKIERMRKSGTEGSRRDVRENPSLGSAESKQLNKQPPSSPDNKTGEVYVSHQ